MDAVITQADLELRYKPRSVRDAACDDGSGTPGPALPSALKAGSRRAQMILVKGGWDAAASAILIQDDEELVTGACDFAMYELTKRNPAWLDAQGKPILSTVNKDAIALFEAVAAASLRPTSEATAGANSRFTNRMNVARSPQYLFAPSRNKPIPGGY